MQKRNEHLYARAKTINVFGPRHWTGDYRQGYTYSLHFLIAVFGFFEGSVWAGVMVWFSGTACSL